MDRIARRMGDHSLATWATQAIPLRRIFPGVPVETFHGPRIGMLCVSDLQARGMAQDMMQDMTPDQKDDLKTVAPQDMMAEEWKTALQEERTARLEAERLLAEKEELLAHNDILMREIDHRVKNSLQIVASMLGFQARRMADSAAAAALEEAQQRVCGIAAVHEQLFGIVDLEQVDMSVFLAGLCTALADNHPDNVEALTVDAAPITLPSTRAMRLGLIVIELVTNACKYAYPDDRRGRIDISLSATEENVHLVVADDGVGLPADFSIEGARGLGMRLIGSVLGQLGGKLSMGPGPGARFVLDIPRAALGAKI